MVDVLSQVVSAVFASDVHAVHGGIQLHNVVEVIAANQLAGDGLGFHGLVEVVVLDPLDDLDGTVEVNLVCPEQEGAGVAVDESAPTTVALLSFSSGAELEKLLIVDFAVDLGENIAAVVLEVHRCKLDG